MKSLSESWELMAGALRKNGVRADLIAQLERGFYAGAWAVLSPLIVEFERDIEAGGGPEQFAATLTGLLGEVLAKREKLSSEAGKPRKPLSRIVKPNGNRY